MVVRMLQTPISELKITFVKYSLGLLRDWVISDG